jgi:IS605 OrfB family transposase
MFQCIESISYIVYVKLTAKVRLKPTDEQAEILLQTMQEANAACDRISVWAWENKTFGQYKIHHGTYHDIKASTRLSAQVVVRCISKVTDAYKLDRNRVAGRRQRTFRPLGAITYDPRILSYRRFPAGIDTRVASVWTVEGRQKIPYATGEHHARLLEYAQGEADLAYVKGKFYLLQTCDIPHEAEQEFDDVVGVDLGITNIAATDDGKIFAGEDLNRLRAARQKVRSSLQSKGTKGAKRVLKRLSGRERTTVKIQNHTIAKKIVGKAKREGKAIAIEDLTGIRSSTNKRLRRSQRGLHNRWSFYQLQQFVSYKAQREGIPVYVVPSPYTSQTCSCCKKIGKRNGGKFSCETCGIQHADTNAAKNIRALGLTVIQAESSTLFCDMVSFVEHVRQG